MSDRIDEPHLDSDPLDDGGDYEVLRPELSPRRKAAVVLLGIAIVLTLVVGAAGYWAYRQLHPSGRAGDEVLVEVQTGSSTSAIADLLEQKGIIGNAMVFKVWLKLKSASSFKAGSYRFQKREDANDVLAALRKGPLPQPAQRFTVPPGLTKREIPDQVVRSIPAFSRDKLAAAITSASTRSQLFPDKTDLEGLLFPETFELAQGASETSVVQVMVQQFDEVATQVGLVDGAARLGQDPYSVVIVASLVEKEVKAPEDAPKVARVIYNRLQQGIPLGVDATLCYLKDQKPCVLRQSELSAPGPYNSRLNKGLPPTPIASPSKAALEAALRPADGPWTYYVLDPQVDPGGTRHLFTSSASEFEAAKARCRDAGFGCG